MNSDEVLLDEVGQLLDTCTRQIVSPVSARQRFADRGRAFLALRVRAEHAESLAVALRDFMSCFKGDRLRFSDERMEAWQAALAKYDQARAGGVIPRGKEGSS